MAVTFSNNQMGVAFIQFHYPLCNHCRFLNKLLTGTLSLCLAKTSLLTILVDSFASQLVFNNERFLVFVSTMELQKTPWQTKQKVGIV